MKKLVIETISYIIRLYSATIVMLNVFKNFVPLAKGKENFIKAQLIPCIVVFFVVTAIHIKYKRE